MMGMMCGQCGEPAVMGMSVWLMDIGDTLPTWVHLDGEPLCPIVGDTGYTPGKPMTVEELEQQK